MAHQLSMRWSAIRNTAQQPRDVQLIEPGRKIGAFFIDPLPEQGCSNGQIAQEVRNTSDHQYIYNNDHENSRDDFKSHRNGDG